MQDGKTNFSDFETNVPNYFVGGVCVSIKVTLLEETEMAHFDSNLHILWQGILVRNITLSSHYQL